MFQTLLISVRLTLRALHACRQIPARLLGQLRHGGRVCGSWDLLIFTLGNLLDPSVRPLVMGRPLVSP